MGDHFYTTMLSERDVAKTVGYEYEGIQCFVMTQPPLGPVAFYRAYNPSNGDHFYTSNISERDNAVNNLGYVAEGTAGWVFISAAESSTALFRLYSPRSGDHFYTISAPERDNAIANLGYRDEGTAGFVYAGPVQNALALHRAFNPRNGDHFYTTDAAEHYNAVHHLGYADEGIACYVHDHPVVALVPLYRCWSSSRGDHFYTCNEAERDNAVNHLGYRAEGIACWVLRAAGAADSRSLFRLYHPGTGDHFYTTDPAERTTAINALGYLDEGITCWVYAASQGDAAPLYRLCKAYDHWLDVNLICVASDTWSTGEWKEMSDAVAVARNIYRDVGLSIRDIGWYTIPSGQAGGYPTIDSGGEAEDLTQDWSVPNSALDVFVVQAMIDADGRSAVNGSCDKDSKGMSGSVVSLNGDAANVGNTLAHEMGHYLGLNHISDTGNFIGGDGASDSWTGIYGWQGDTMKKHCFVHSF